MSAMPSKPTGPLFWAIYAVMAALGVASLCPWNAYLNAGPYFKFVLAGHRMEASYPSYVTSVYTLSVFLTMVLMVMFKADSRVPVTARAVGGLLANMLLLALIAAIPIAQLLKGSPLLGQSAFVGVVLAVVALNSSATAVMMKSFYEMIAILPTEYIPAFNIGQAVAGVFVSSVGLVSALYAAGTPTPASVLKGSIFYFSVAILVFGGSLLGFLWLKEQAFYIQSIKTSEAAAQPEDKAPGIVRPFLESTRLVWDIALGITATMGVTIAMISSYLPSVASTRSGLWAAAFTPITFLAFNLGDLAGRWLPGISLLSFSRRSRWPYLLPWLRLVIFPPLFLASNLYAKPRWFPYIIRWDALYLALVFAFGLTSGYCCTLLFMLAPGRVAARAATQLLDQRSTDRAKGQAGAVLGLFLYIGLLTGALASFPLRFIVA